LSDHIWLAGMPEYSLCFDERSVPSVLLGCRNIARALFNQCRDETSLRTQLEHEYESVLEALLNAGMPFRILNLDSAESPLADRLRAAGYPEFHIEARGQGSTYAYPRDLMVYLADFGIALVSDGWLRPGAGDRDGVACWATSWSEGGRVLMRDDTLVVFRHPQKTGAHEQATLNALRERGLRVVEIPAGVFCSIDRDGDLTGLFYDHHIDRAAGLVRGLDGALHLILGPGYRTGPLDAPMDIPTSCDAVRQICDTAGITVHALPETCPPYAASLVQSADGVVVASGGHDAFLEILANIVGHDNVVPTAIPLTHFPVFASAGLHCLVTESPEFLLAPRSVRT